MSVSIKVSVRCRPFTIDDKLGVQMLQLDENNGEINLINSSYSTNRFGFTYSWWSAYGWKRHCKSNEDIAEDMKLTNQIDCYKACGLKVKADLYDGNAVVLFAYGLSGSGKTFTVFGPDDPAADVAWFKHEDPHDLWGIFPRLGHEIFQDIKDGWKVKLKYFQNIVDVVRDLMDPVGKEQTYKSVLADWADLRQTFQTANGRKAIAPTQFNHQSTRGHCIMVLEVEMPKPSDPSTKQRGRVYVCDLAGTEPAGDIVFAKYKTKKYPDGTVEHKFIGAHKDKKKTKELQDQGKKINLSLSEMAQFFMKMAQAIKKKQLKPGKSIPGCNSYFLCKFLKDTMLQARTYLFCAIRPECKYHPYTFSTLGFAKNASVIKLSPKKATVACSPAERKMMKELEKMKQMMAAMSEENEKLQKSGGGGGGDDSAEEEDEARLAEMQKNLDKAKAQRASANTTVTDLQAKLAKAEAAGESEKVKALEAELAEAKQKYEEETNERVERERKQKQKREEYAARGIGMVAFEPEESEPHFVNLDEDEYRSERFIFWLKKDENVFGPGGDVRPFSVNTVQGHCTVKRKGKKWTLVGGAGATYLNGKTVPKGKSKSIKAWDRVVIGGDVLQFVIPGVAPNDNKFPAEVAIGEYQSALAQFEEEKKQWEAKMKAGRGKLSVEEENALREEDLMNGQIIQLLPKLKELKILTDTMDRGYLSFEAKLLQSHTNSGKLELKVKVHNGNTHEDTLIDTFELDKAYNVLKEEHRNLSIAVENGRDYTVELHHDPVQLLFDNTFHLGTSIIFPEFLLGYMLGTDEEEDEQFVDIKNSMALSKHIGKLEVIWIPMEPDDIYDTEDLIGKPWTYKLMIRNASGLPITADVSFVQYDFFGELFTTETITEETDNPIFNYTYIHHLDAVTDEFIQWLKKPMEFHLHVSPVVKDTGDEISSKNPHVHATLSGKVSSFATKSELIKKISKLENTKTKLEKKLSLCAQELDQYRSGKKPKKIAGDISKEKLLQK
eukprot:GSMAST32.ASY1.ANO1.190.1 assembled CDS